MKFGEKERLKKTLEIERIMPRRPLLTRPLVVAPLLIAGAINISNAVVVDTALKSGYTKGQTENNLSDGIYKISPDGSSHKVNWSELYRYVGKPGREIVYFWNR